MTDNKLDTKELLKFIEYLSYNIENLTSDVQNLHLTIVNDENYTSLTDSTADIYDSMESFINEANKVITELESKIESQEA